MALIATDGNRFSNVFKFEFEPSVGTTRDVVTVNLAADATLAVGTVLAKVTATGKYLVQSAALASGAGLDNCVVLIGVDEQNLGAACVAATDKKVLVLARGPAKVAKEQLIYAAATDTAAEKLAVWNDLAKVGIVVVDQI